MENKNLTKKNNFLFEIKKNMQSRICSKVMFAILQEILSKTSVDFNEVISHLALHILVLM